MSNKSLAVIALVFTVAIVVSHFSYKAGIQAGVRSMEHELKICADEVSNGCPNTTAYALMLEKENARLNKICRSK